MRNSTLIALSLLAVAFSACLCVGEATLSRVFQDDTGGTAYNVALGDGYVFVSNNEGISIYDVRDPEQPAFVTLYDTPSGGAFDLDVVGSTLYAAAIQDGLLVLDISHPAEPLLLGAYGRDVTCALVHHGIAYVCQIGRNMELVDISDPSHPILLSQIGWGGDLGMAASGDTVYVTEPGRGIAMLDVTDPRNVIVRGIVPGTASAYKLEARGEELYVAQFGQGVSAFGIANPRTPVRLFSFPHTGEAYVASGVLPYICVADLQEGVEVIDASVPSAPVPSAVDSTLAPHAVCYADGYVHVADQDDGYVLLRLTDSPIDADP
ncbi:hypothetical protein JW848_06445 [Candidatus Bipolaricaulota bacterium]|nr:hypothetical protein [Candidatus Bipolaricaulota bacterium]